MYASETHKSARQQWRRAPMLQRRDLLCRAGHAANCTAYAYLRFEDLPIEVKLDLNREAVQPQGNPAPASQGQQERGMP